LGETKGITMKTISAIAADQSFKAMFVLSCFGLGVSVCLIVLGMDLNVAWL